MKDVTRKLREILKDKSAVKEKDFSLEGSVFPLGLTKRFISTFNTQDGLVVTVTEDKLQFFWRHGSARINSVPNKVAK